MRAVRLGHRNRRDGRKNCLTSMQRGPCVWRWRGGRARGCLFEVRAPKPKRHLAFALCAHGLAGHKLSLGGRRHRGRGGGGKRGRGRVCVRGGSPQGSADLACGGGEAGARAIALQLRTAGGTRAGGAELGTRGGGGRLGLGVYCDGVARRMRRPFAPSCPCSRQRGCHCDSSRNIGRAVSKTGCCDQRGRNRHHLFFSLRLCYGTSAVGSPGWHDAGVVVDAVWDRPGPCACSPPWAIFRLL